MHSLAIARFELPGEAGFPLNAMYTRPADSREEETMRRLLNLYICQNDPANHCPFYIMETFPLMFLFQVTWRSFGKRLDSASATKFLTRKRTSHPNGGRVFPSEDSWARPSDAICYASQVLFVSQLGRCLGFPFLPDFFSCIYTLLILLMVSPIRHYDTAKK